MTRRSKADRGHAVDEAARLDHQLSASAHSSEQAQHITPLLLQFSLDPNPFCFNEISGQLDHMAGVGIAFCRRLTLTRGICQLEQRDRVGLGWVQ